MTPSQLLAYLGPAMIFAAVVAAILFAVLRATRAKMSGQLALTLFLALFFLALTQHPFPDRATLDCSTGGVARILQPFATFDHVGRLWRHWQNVPEIGLSAWLGSKIIQAAVMNLILCAAIGAAFARHAPARHPYLAALGLGVLLSGGAEVAQLTGFFGLYPCPWRTFEVDDLIFNISGVVGGFALMRAVLGGGTRPRQPPSTT
ncbi:MAG: VanZ family protein [Gemmobacter sp.]